MRATGDNFICDYCHNVFVPPQDDQGVTVLGDGPGDQCPICISTPLQQAAIAKMPLLYCSKCHGMLASMQVFEPLIEAERAQQHANVAPPPVDPHDLERHIACPHCHRTMETYYYAGPGNVVLDSCEDCSFIWLDHGELLRIARAPANDFAQDSDS